MTVTAGNVAVTGTTAIWPDPAALGAPAPAEDACPGADPECPDAVGLEVVCLGADPECPGDLEVAVELEVLWPGAEADFPCAAAVARPASTA